MRRGTLQAGLVALAVLPLQGGPPARLAPHTAEIDHEFTRITWVRELDADRILVSDPGERAVLVADWRTRAAKQVGREGRGPREYAAAGALLRLRGDSTILVDGPSARWLVLVGDSIHATIPPETPAVRAGGRSALHADTLGNVMLTRPVLPPTPPVASGTAPTADSLALIRIHRDSDRHDTIAVIAARPARIRATGTEQNPAFSITFNPFTTGDAPILFPDGWFAIARPNPYRVDWITPDKRILRGAPLPFESHPATEREKRFVLETQAITSGNLPRDPAAVPDWPETIPAFTTGNSLAAADGRLWIRRMPRADAPETLYDIVDRRGARAARVTMAANERVIAVGRFAVYVVFTDDDGIQHLRRHPLPRR